MKKCPKCGTACEDSCQICANCGVSLEHLAREKEKQRENKDHWEIKKEGGTTIYDLKKTAWFCPECGKEYPLKYNDKCLKCLVPLQHKTEKTKEKAGIFQKILSILQKHAWHPLGIYKKYSMYCFRCKKYYPGVWRECQVCKKPLISSKIPLCMHAAKMLGVFILVAAAVCFGAQYFPKIQALAVRGVERSEVQRVAKDIIQKVDIKYPQQPVREEPEHAGVAPEKTPEIWNINFGQMSPDGQIIVPTAQLVLPEKEDAQLWFGYTFDYSAGARFPELTTILELPGTPDKDMGPNFDAETNSIRSVHQLERASGNFGHKWYFVKGDLAGRYNFKFYIRGECVGSIEFEVVESEDK